MEKKKGAKSTAQRNLLEYTHAPSIKSVFNKTESIIKFKEFTMIKELRGAIEEDEDVIAFLYSLKNNDVNAYVNDFLTCGINDKEYFLEDILLEIGGLVDDDKYHWISNELKKFLSYAKREH